MVLAVFNKSERVRKDYVHFATDDPQSGSVEVRELAPSSSGEAAPYLGGYKRSDVQHLEGRYVCFRSAFSTSEVINAYLISVHWDEGESSLCFEEQERIDAGHTQRGRVYIPDGRPFISFVTIEKGALRLIMVSRPEGNRSAHGIITTLSKPGSAGYIPTSGPIVLRRVIGKLPQLGFIQPGALDYDGYRAELEMVMPSSAFFATAHGTTFGADALPNVPPRDIGLAPAMEGAHAVRGAIECSDG
jgi:hypothetical protein